MTENALYLLVNNMLINTHIDDKIIYLEHNTMPEKCKVYRLETLKVMNLMYSCNAVRKIHF